MQWCAGRFCRLQLSFGLSVVGLRSWAALEQRLMPQVRWFAIQAPSLVTCITALLPRCLAASLPCCRAAVLPCCLTVLLPLCLAALLPGSTTLSAANASSAKSRPAWRSSRTRCSAHPQRCMLHEPTPTPGPNLCTQRWARLICTARPTTAAPGALTCRLLRCWLFRCGAGSSKSAPRRRGGALGANTRGRRAVCFDRYLNARPQGPSLFLGPFSIYQYFLPVPPSHLRARGLKGGEEKQRKARLVRPSVNL